LSKKEDQKDKAEEGVEIYQLSFEEEEEGKQSILN
jgi:hypothetical protein